MAKSNTLSAGKTSTTFMWVLLGLSVLTIIYVALNKADLDKLSLESPYASITSGSSTLASLIGIAALISIAVERFEKKITTPIFTKKLILILLLIILYMSTFMIARTILQIFGII